MNRATRAMHAIKLPTGEEAISACAPYKWVHPDEER